MSNDAPVKTPLRKIIHIDMDAFFASIEQRDHPAWKGLPVIVAGTPQQRGVVSTASYEARKFGIHSAMPSSTAHRLCPQGIFVRGNMEHYREVSSEIRNIFHQITDLVEPLSIDEAFLDVTCNNLGEVSATRTAQFIQQEIYRKTRLTASAGVSFNKFLAKIASDWRKPSGLTVIPPELAQNFLDQLPIERFYGVGEATARIFHQLNVANGSDLRALPLEELLKHFGKMGGFYYKIVRGIDERAVNPIRIRKSLGREITLPQDTRDLKQIRALLRHLCVRVAELLQAKRLAGRTVTLKLRYDDFTTITRSLSGKRLLSAADILEELGKRLLTKTEAGRRKIRLLGLSVSGFPEENELKQPELPLFPEDIPER